MKTIFLNLIIFLSGAAVWGQSSPKQITWHVNRTDSIGGFPVTVLGQPKIVEKEGFTAVEFDGKKDGLIVDGNPMVGATTEFTIEVIFMVYEEATFAQRFVHFQQDDNNRILVELRKSAKDKWFLDTFIKSGSSSHTLLSEGKDHDINVWNHIALVYKGNKMTHYVDGVEELSGSVTYAEVNSGKTSLGMRLNKVSWYTGAIRLVRVTHKALTLEEFIINEKQDTAKPDSTTHTLSNFSPALSLSQLLPLPLKTTGVIHFSVSKPGRTTINIFNTNGKKQPIFDKFLEPGSYSATINGASLSTGLYFCRLSSGQDNISKKFIVE